MRACLIDLDGTVVEGDRLVPGARRALAALREAGIPFRFVTNTTRRPRSALLVRLADLGVEAAAEDCVTAPVAAARWLAERGVERLLPLLPEATLEDLPGFRIDEDAPEVVLVGDLGDGWSYEILNRALRALLGGADLVAIQHNRFWTEGGRACLDAGAFVAALEYASRQEAEVVGKPSAAFFRAAAEGLGVPPSRIAMVGDDLDSDVAGAQAAGLVGVAVRTGKYRHQAGEPRTRAPDAVLDSVADLPGWLEGTF